MSKRTLVSPAPSPGRQKKKAKVSAGQARLDTFFSASSSRTPVPTGAPDTSRPSSSKVASTQKPVSPRGGEELPKPALTDEELAWALAAEDGLDLDALRKLELRSAAIGSASANLPATAPGKSTPAEVIDVDELDDPPLQNDPGPSSRTKPSSGTPVAAVAQFAKHTAERPAAPASKQTIGNASLPATQTFGPLDVDPPSYDPSSAGWPPNAPVPYSFLAHTLATLSATRSRIAKLNTLTNALRAISRQHPASLLPALYLLSNTLSPPYSPIELGLGPAIISKAIQHVSGLSSAALRRLYTSTGDPGKPGRVPRRVAHSHAYTPQGTSRSRPGRTSAR